MKRKSVVLLVTLILLITMGTLEYYGIIWHTSVFTLPYDVKGLDVSHYQLDIDWDKVSNDEYPFIFMKATEGEDYVDYTFETNWREAKGNGFLVGAYHFFVTSSTSENQAKNFIHTVPVSEDALPPVIDIEIDTDENVESVMSNLQVMIDQLYAKYDKYPILYVTYETYNTYILGHFEQCPIWIRDIVKHPSLKGDRDWTFWQYCNRGRIEGIDSYVDINVFHGTMEEFVQLINK